MAGAGRLLEKKDYPEHFPAQNVVGEIKPHNPDGIREGIEQLRGRRQSSDRHRRPQLITYLPLDGTRFAVYVARPDLVMTATDTKSQPARRRDATKALTSGRRGELLGTPGAHIQIATLNVPKANELIKRRDCPTMLGNMLEHPIRMAYQGFVKKTVRPFADIEKRSAYMDIHLHRDRKSPSAGGPDIRHELRDFLRELASELDSPW